VYGSNRGHDTIVVYSVDQQTGKLTYVENESTVGKTPRSFGIDPTGNFLLAANQASNNILIFRIDQQTGELEYTGHGVDCPTPVCIIFTFAPSGQQ
jgi:6-phosphogluconolactonase